MAEEGEGGGAAAPAKTALAVLKALSIELSGASRRGAR
jgi:hypothetical protein